MKNLMMKNQPLLVIMALLLLTGLACGSFSMSDLEEYLVTSEPASSSSWQPAQDVAGDYLPTVLAQIQGTPIGADELPVKAVVQIVVRGTVDGVEQEWSGSGTIISPDGLILTNAHVAMGDRFYPAEQLLILLTVAEDQLPQEAFYAEVLQADESLDIAVLSPAVDLTGKKIDRAALNLPYVSLGNSDELHLGDDIAILGYPGIGGETITLTRGEVSGFTSEANYGNRAYIKTSATIAGGNSGGLALNASNQLIGIPTEVGAGEETGEVVDCRPLADTNRDGVVDNYDTCVPTGGFINALRPVNLAMPLIDAALRGEVAYSDIEQLPVAEVAEGSTIVYRDDFSDKNTGWPEADDSDVAYRYRDGSYIIDVKSSNYIRPITGGEDLEDVIVEIDARVEQSSGDGEFGLICRYKDDNNMYMFEVTQDGYYAIYRMLNGTWSPLVDYTYSDLVASLTSANVQAACIDNSLSLAIEGKVLAEAQDNSIKSGDYGFFAGTFSNSNHVISFDNLKVSQP